MSDDHDPICVGYIRQCPTSQEEDYQRERLTWWYCHHARDQYEWGGFCRDDPKAPDEIQRKGHMQHCCTYMSVRQGCQEMLEKLKPGDLLIACRLGVLCNDITDALEGLPGLLGRGIRIVLTEGHVELTRG